MILKTKYSIIVREASSPVYSFSGHLFVYHLKAFSFGSQLGSDPWKVLNFVCGLVACFILPLPQKKRKPL